MKTTILKIGFIFLFLVTLGAGCEKEKEEPRLPPVTQAGKDTFGCLVNGNIWLPKLVIAFPTQPKVSAELVREYGYQMWEIGASQGAASGFYFGIYEDSLKEGKINISTDEMYGSGIGLHFFSKNYEGTSFAWEEGLPGELTISKLDTVNMILSGTFWFDAINDRNEKVEIRDGRFDLIIDQIQP